MRAHLPSYEMKTPASLHEALTLLANEPGKWRPFAGGTDIMVQFEAGKLAHRKFLNILNIAELKGITKDKEHLTLGALTTYSQLQANAVMRAEFPLLCQAGSETGAIAIQNRGTLGGNIVNASPAADSPPALVVYDAELELVSAQGVRWVAYPAFHKAYKKMDLRPDELLQRIRLKRNTAGAHQYYRKVGTRRAQAISKVCFAGVARQSKGLLSDIRIALGSVGPTVVRIPNTEAALNGKKLSSQLIAQARNNLAAEITPLDDIRSSAAFRVRVAQNLLEEFLCGIGSQN
ncbi:MAG: xanthine dehydrogenase family protein subunit M [Deltaproteobacteria bacterium]|nr:xanthine dehydrogenase family protein subunit M [Deltaproteobacteria bacterium]